LIFGLLASLIGSHFVAKAVNNEFKDRKEWIRMSLSLIVLVISFAIMVAIAMTIALILKRL